MNIFLIIIAICTIIFTPKTLRKLTNPAIVFTLLWAFIMQIAHMRVFALNSYSDSVMVIVVVGVVSFVLGYIGAVYTRDMNFVFNDDRRRTRIYEYEINYRLLYVVALICILYYAKDFVQSLILILQGSDLEIIRRMAQDDSAGGMTGSALNNLISNFVVLPCASALEVLAVVDFWRGKRNIKLFVMTIIIIFMRVIGDAGRTPLVNFAVYLIIGFLLVYDNDSQNNLKDKIKALKDKKLVRRYGVIGFVLILIASISRTSSTLLRQVYFYFSMAPVLFTYWKEEVDRQGLVTFGLTSLNGFFFSVVYFFKNLFGVEYPQLLQQAYDMISYTDSQWQTIAQVNIKANAYVSAFWFMYTDGRILGVIVGMFLYGFVISRSFCRTKKYKTIKSMAIYLILFQGLVFSFIRFPFAKIYYALAVIFILLLAFRKSNDNKEGVSNVKSQ